MNGYKPLGKKSYGSIPHLPGSRMGPKEHHITEGQLKICTEKTRDRHDIIIVQEKLDGSNVGVCKINGEIIAITRAGWNAASSPFEQHHCFDRWVKTNSTRFDELLNEGERVCGEWLMQAHGTRYNLYHEPFVPFDIFSSGERLVFTCFHERIMKLGFVWPATLNTGSPFSIDKAIESIKTSCHGAIDPVEGAVWRVERNKVINKKTGERKWVVDFLAKYVRPDKKDGIYLPEISGKEPVYNWRP